MNGTLEEQAVFVSVACAKRNIIARSNGTTNVFAGLCHLAVRSQPHKEVLLNAKTDLRLLDPKLVGYA